MQDGNDRELLALALRNSAINAIWQAWGDLRLPDCWLVAGCLRADGLEQSFRTAAPVRHLGHRPCVFRPLGPERGRGAGPCRARPCAPPGNRGLDRRQERGARPSLVWGEVRPADPPLSLRGRCHRHVPDDCHGRRHSPSRARGGSLRALRIGRSLPRRGASEQAADHTRGLRSKGVAMACPLAQLARRRLGRGIGTRASFMATLST